MRCTYLFIFMFWAVACEVEGSVETGNSVDSQQNNDFILDGNSIWVSPAELAVLPVSGSAWKAVLSKADDGGTADVSDQNSNHDTATLAAALVCVRLSDPVDCNKARGGLLAAIGTEEGGRWLAVGRNMLAYTIAADLLSLHADGNPRSDGSRIEAWLAGFLTRTLSHNNDSSRQVPLAPFESGSNASAQEGAVYIAIAAYLGDREALNRGWDAFRTYACDPSAPDREDIDLNRGVEYGWAADIMHPVPSIPRER